MRIHLNATNIKVVIITSAVWFIFFLVASQYLFNSDPPQSIVVPHKQIHEDGSEEEVPQTKGVRRGDKGFNVIRKVLKESIFPADKNGPGEGGKPYRLSSSDQAEKEKLFKIHQFNILASDHISVNRSLPDYRNTQCQMKDYPGDLPTTSVIIVFHNEAWSTLLRTVHSVLNRSPHDLLVEVILVDDKSTMEHLGDKLDSYVKKLKPHVHVYRMPERSGLVQARLAGAKIAKGDTLTFLDAHCECVIGWLEPLLDEVKKDRKVAIAPIVDVISDDDFGYYTGSETTWGGFNWKLQFRWYAAAPREVKRRGGDRTAPVQSPTHAGGLFTIDKSYFYELGAYDSGYTVWGGENLELSFRVWMCGGRLLIHPCSRVGHVFRKVSPYHWPGGISYVLNHNAMRTALVWLDDYKEFYLLMNPGAKETDYGDITERVALRKNLKCHSFKWYIENVYPEGSMPAMYYSLGLVKNGGDPSRCLDSGGKDDGSPLLAFGCHGQGGNQAFSLTFHGHLASDEDCVDGAGYKPIMTRCPPNSQTDSRKTWAYESGMLKNQHSGNCLTLANLQLSMQECDRDSQSQQWQLDNYDPTGHSNSHPISDF